MAERFIKLTDQDIVPTQEDAITLFYSGIRTESYRATLDKHLKMFLVNVCADLFEGTYEQRAQQFVDLARKDQKRVLGIVTAYVRHLRERTMVDRKDPGYMSPQSLPNKIKPIKKLLDMNDVGLPWKRIHMMYPEFTRSTDSRGYTRDEIKKLLEYSDSLSTAFVILAESSGGFRVGAWQDQVWGNLFPIYEADREYKVELEKGQKAKVVCAGLKIYKGSPEEYVALISIEAWNKLQEYRKWWTYRMGRQPKESDPLLIARFNQTMTPMTASAVKQKIEKLLVRSGMRIRLQDGRRRHEVPETNGFRRYWDKIMMQNKSKKGTLSALVIKERLMGHHGLVKTDKNYFWTSILELVPEYLDAMPDLLISDELKLEMRIGSKDKQIHELAKKNKEKDESLQRLSELEAKVLRMQKYQVVK